MVGPVLDSFPNIVREGCQLPVAATCKEATTPAAQSFTACYKDVNKAGSTAPICIRAGLHVVPPGGSTRRIPCLIPAGLRLHTFRTRNFGHAFGD